MRLDIVTSYIQEGPSVIRWGGAGIVVVASALWHSLMSILASVLGVLFLVDLTLGVLRAMHVRGIDSFDWQRFTRAWIKLGAAVVGIALFSLGDMLLHESGLPPDVKPLTSAALFGMSWGFFWSATTNLSYFFPQVGQWTNTALKKIGQQPDEDLEGGIQDGKDQRKRPL